MSYSYPYYGYPKVKEGKKRSFIAVLLIGLIIGVIVGGFLVYQFYATVEIEKLQSKYADLKARYESLHKDYENLVEKYEKLHSDFQDLSARYAELEKNYAKLKLEYDKLKKEKEFSEEQIRELLYYRLFIIYDYTTGARYYAWYRVKAVHYLKYRSDPSLHTPASTENRLIEDFLLKSVNSWRDPESDIIREIASDLATISRGDEELYVNLALQLVHQLYYNITLYTKYPIETLVEGSGDCDNLACLLAAILRAGGLKVAVLVVEVPGGGAHAMVGVALSHPPKHLFYFGRSTYWYYDYNGVRYYLCEATWMRPEQNTPYIHPASDQALYVVGSLVGDNPWGSGLKVITVIEVP